MERVGELLGRVARRLNRPEASLAWLAGAWPQIVGQALAAHTRPIRCREGLLEVTADGKLWQNQLEEMKDELRLRINQAFGGKLVREVKLAAERSAGPGLSHEMDNEHVPFIRRHRC
jgi:predicted nucleic acid-binding Zn ribbon protein